MCGVQAHCDAISCTPWTGQAWGSAPLCAGSEHVKPAFALSARAQLMPAPAGDADAAGTALHCEPVGLLALGASAKHDRLLPARWPGPQFCTRQELADIDHVTSRAHPSLMDVGSSQLHHAACDITFCVGCRHMRNALQLDVPELIMQASKHRTRQVPSGTHYKPIAML